ncbi:MAG: ATP-dependent DNA helicase [bacterium]
MIQKLKLDENQLQTPNGLVITLTPMQTEGVREIKKWLKDKTSPFFTLGGVAGSGKTTVIKKVIDDYFGSVVVSAPTHKAKKKVASTTGKRAETLHSICGLRPDLELDSFNPNNPIFNPIAKPIINLIDFLIIDEASMINEGFLNLIRKQVQNKKVKILFMGDDAQIPPIGEEMSAVFVAPDIKMFWLSEIMRQSYNNPITKVYDHLRNNLENYDPIIRETMLNDNQEGIIFMNKKQDYRREVFAKYGSENFKKDYDFVKIIGWRNTTIGLANTIVRGHLFPNKRDIIEVGDVLMGYRNIMADRMRYNIIENSCDYRVVKKSELIKNEHDIWGYNVSLREDLINNEYAYRKVFIVKHDDIDNFHKYGDYHDYYKIQAIRNKKLWKKYYAFRRENIILSDLYTYKPNQERVPEDVIVKDLDFGYAITAHKSQGSTYEHAFILEDDMDANPKIKERNQIKYVGITRPSKRCYLI